MAADCRSWRGHSREVDGQALHVDRGLLRRRRVGGAERLSNPMTEARMRCMAVLTLHQSWWFSFHSSYHAIWMASSFGSFDVFGSSSNPSS